MYLMGDQLYLSAEVTLMMLSATGWGWWVPCLTRGQKQSEDKAVMKDKPFVPTTESYILQLLFYQIAFVSWGGFLNNAIG